MSSGLAKQLHGWAEAGTSETVSLAGYDHDRVQDLIESAFRRPLKVPSPPGMVRFTFVVGGGKNSRQKFAHDLQKSLVAALRDIGFTEDHSAWASPECAGTYKTQHDTAANLKYVLVFPLLDTEAAPASSGILPLPDNDPSNAKPLQLMLMSEMASFREMVSAKMRSWSQKKRALDALKEVTSKLQQCTEQLVDGHVALSSEQQSLYDSVDLDGLHEKTKFLSHEMSEQASTGQLTAAELHEVKKLIEAKIADTESHAHSKKLEFFHNQRDMLEKCQPWSGPPLPHEEMLLSLYAELRPLEAHTAGHKLLTLEQTTELGHLQERVDKLELEAKNDAWFEHEDEFLARIAALKKRSAEVTTTSKRSAKAKSHGSSTKDDGEWQTSRKGGKHKSSVCTTTTSSNPWGALSKQ